MSTHPATAQQPPLLRTKLSIPQSPPEYVPRPRLTERLHRGARGPLTLITAPAGYGKTNVLVEWAQETPLPVAWLTLDGEDNNPGRFFRYLLAALQTRQPGLGEEALDFVQSAQGGELEAGLAALINELDALPAEMALALDEFQALEDPALVKSVAYFLKHLPHTLHLVIASRSEPPLDLTLLRARGRVVELGAEDLRFTGDEVAQLFQRATGLRLPADTARTLAQRTDGWATALQMAAISVQNESDLATVLANPEGDAHTLFRFLAEEVLDRQPEEVREFLLRSSILDLLTGPLCEAVVNPESKPGYGTAMLSRLEQANLFVTALDPKHEWFRYHHLFADFLRHVEAEIHPAEVPKAHLRAAAWFEQNGNVDEALRHALASGDLEGAADSIERNIVALFQTGETAALVRWAGRLPGPVLHRRPRLSLAYAWGLLAAYRLDEARYWMDDVQRVLDSPNYPAVPDDGGPWNVRGGLALCRSLLAVLSGDMEQGAKLSREAAEVLREDNPVIRSLLALEDSLYLILSGDTRQAIESLRGTLRLARQANNLMVAIIAACALADMQALSGHLSQAWETLERTRGMALGPGGKPLPLAGLVDLPVGRILLERNSLEEAAEYLERGVRVTQTLWWIGSLEGVMSLARLRQIQGDVSDSQATLEEAARIALSTESSRWDKTAVSAFAIRLALQRDDLVAAEQWRKKGGFPEPDGTIPMQDYPYHVNEYLLLTQVRFLLARGRATGNADDLRRASELLAMLLQESERLQRVSSHIEILVLQALAQDALGDDRATRTLLEALELGEPEGYRRVYLDEGRRLAGLLRRCRSAQRHSGNLLPSAAFIDSLLQAVEEGLEPVPPAPEARPAQGAAHLEDGLPVLLSAREMEVLVLLAEGKSNQEISAQLYLALNTVKRHVYNIYAKLDVQKRTQAVSRARQLGLLP